MTTDERHRQAARAPRLPWRDSEHPGERRRRSRCGRVAALSAVPIETLALPGERSHATRARPRERLASTQSRGAQAPGRPAPAPGSRAPGSRYGSSSGSRSLNISREGCIGRSLRPQVAVRTPRSCRPLLSEMSACSGRLSKRRRRKTVRHSEQQAVPAGRGRQKMAARQGSAQLWRSERHGGEADRPCRPVPRRRRRRRRRGATAGEGRSPANERSARAYRRRFSQATLDASTSPIGSCGSPATRARRRGRRSRSEIRSRFGRACGSPPTRLRQRSQMRPSTGTPSPASPRRAGSASRPSRGDRDAG